MGRGAWSPDERCQAALADNLYHRKWTDLRCSYHQMFAVNGKALCGRHASLELLHLAVVEGRVTQIASHKLPHSAVDVVSKDWKPK